MDIKAELTQVARDIDRYGLTNKQNKMLDEIASVRIKTRKRVVTFKPEVNKKGGLSVDILVDGRKAGTSLWGGIYNESQLRGVIGDVERAYKVNMRSNSRDKKSVDKVIDNILDFHK
jgi:hypothetical protein